MADTTGQPLSGAEAQQLEAEQAQASAEAQTGTQPLPRADVTEDPSVIDPRFDRDDLRQGKPAPAVRKGHLPRKIKVRRPRNLKGTPFKKGEKNTKVGSTSAAGSDAVDQEHDEADLTDEEVEVDDEEVEPEEKEEKKSGGLLSKITGKS